MKVIILAGGLVRSISKIPYRSNVMPCSCVDLTRLIEDTGFRPGMPFDRGIAEVIERIRKAVP